MGLRACLDGAENLAPTGIRSPDRPARSESQYRLSYRGSEIDNTVNILCICWSKPFSVHNARYIHQDRTSGRLPLNTRRCVYELVIYFHCSSLCYLVMNSDTILWLADGAAIYLLILQSNLLFLSVVASVAQSL